MLAIIPVSFAVSAVGLGVGIYRCSSNRKATTPPNNRHLIDPLKPNEKVKIIGLKTNTDLNKKEGKIVQYDPSNNRYQVRLHDTTSVNVKPENLQRKYAVDIKNKTDEQITSALQKLGIHVRYKSDTSDDISLLGSFYNITITTSDIHPGEELLADYAL